MLQASSEHFTARSANVPDLKVLWYIICTRDISHKAHRGMQTLLRQLLHKVLQAHAVPFHAPSIGPPTITVKTCGFPSETTPD